MPKVLLDLRMVRGRLHGIARYALELARRLPAIAPSGWEVVGLAPPDGLPPHLGELTPALKLERAGAEFLSPWEQIDLPRVLSRTRCDLFHATSFSVPAFWGGRLVATLHDANHLDRAGDYGMLAATYFNVVVAPRVRRARALLTVSQFSRDALSRHLETPRDRWRIVAPGVGAAFRPGRTEAVSRFRVQHHLPDRYFLAVGNTKPFKNLSLLAKIAPDLPAPIALLAGAGAAAQLGFPPSTIDLGEVPDRDLPLLYCGALALLLPSRYEGFGLPALEAMACGCPVIAARAGALPEVLGEAGQLADPDDSVAWREKAARFASDPATRTAWIEPGIRRAAKFTWEACARGTFEAYLTAMREPA